MLDKSFKLSKFQFLHGARHAEYYTWDKVCAHILQAILVIGIIPDLRHRGTRIISDFGGFLKTSVRETIVFVTIVTLPRLLHFIFLMMYYKIPWACLTS